MTKILPEHLLGTGHLLLVATFFNVSGIISSLAGGILFDWAGGDALYCLIGISALLGTVSLFIYKQTMRPVKKTVFER